jgi:carbonic anhydrase
MRPILKAIFALTIVSGSGCSSKPHWDYRGNHDPGHWYELSQQAKVCKTGHHQSPIDIHSGETESLEQDLEIHYHKAPLDVVNNGHTVEFDTKDSHYILLDGQRYNLVQFHFHAHSEHALDGKYFPAEMHLVHKSEEG